MDVGKISCVARCAVCGVEMLHYIFCLAGKRGWEE